MRKTLKHKIVNVVVALMMVLGMSAMSFMGAVGAASADPMTIPDASTATGTPGTITINANNIAGTALDPYNSMTLNLYKIFDLTLVNPGQADASYAYTLASAFDVTVDGLSFLQTADNALGNPGITTVQQLVNYLGTGSLDGTDTAITGDNTYPTPNDLRNFADAMEKFIADSSPTIASVDSATITAPTMSKTFTPNALGYYLVTATVDNGTTVDGTQYPSTVVSSVILGSNDVNITSDLKLDVPSITKQVSNDYINNGTGSALDQSAETSIGSTVNFTLTSKVPNMYDYTSYTFTMNDTLSAGLTLGGNQPIDSTNATAPGAAGATVGDPNFVVTIQDATLGNKTLTEGTDASSGDYYVTGPDSNGNFTITFNNFIQWAKYSGDPIVVTYDATLNQNAIVSSTGNVKPNPNTVTLTYSNSPYSGGSGTTTTGPTESDVYTYQLQVDKFASDMTTPLAGAQFTLKDNAGNTVYVIDNGNGTYTVDQNSSGSPIDTVTSGDGNNGSTLGQLIIYGLDGGNYTLTETTPPAGYNALPNPLPITIQTGLDTNGGQVGSSADVNDVTVSFVGDGESCTADGTVINIPDTTGTQLPGTGGMGTTIFYAVGGIIVLGALVVMITRRRTNDGTNNA